MMTRTRVGAWGVEASAARLADLHGALLASVTCLGAWVAVAPELEMKIDLAYHLYEQAYLADLIGQRIHALISERLGVPSPSNRALLYFLRELASLQRPAEQVAGLYRVLLPALLDSCREHQKYTNPVADEPTVRILYQASEILQEQVIWGAHQQADSGAIERFQRCLQGVGGLHGSGTPCDGPMEIRPYLIDTPARDARFTLLTPGKKIPKAKPLETPEGRVRLLHIALINLEIPAIEVCGRMIAEFPDAPWEMKLDLANQMWDEARHALMCADRLVELGGQIGQFAYHHRVWEHSIAGRSLPERFVTTQRIHEGNGLDQTKLARDALAALGDDSTSQIMDFIMADEVIHVRNGNKWIERLVPDAESRAELLQRVEERLGMAATVGPPLNRAGRRRAGFTEIELDWLTAIRERRR